MSFMEKVKTVATAPVEAKAVSYTALIVAILALGISFGMLLSHRGGNH